MCLASELDWRPWRQRKDRTNAGFPAAAGLTYTEGMQLRTARLCLDCEEVHETQECPICLSQAGVFLTKWIPAEERRMRRFPSAIKVTPVTTRDPVRWVKRGVLGLAVLAASRWLLQAGSDARSRQSQADEQPDKSG